MFYSFLKLLLTLVFLPVLFLYLLALLIISTIRDAGS